MANPELQMANLLLDCLQEAFLTPVDDYPTPGNFCLRSSESPITDDMDPLTGGDLCCEGLAWVRIGDTYPSSNFPEPDSTTKGCFPTSWALTLEAGLLRCYHPGGEPGMASCADHTDNAIQDSIAINILKNAACCWGQKLKAIAPSRLWAVQGIVINGPRSNCIDRTMTILTGSPKCC
jgi:hypothetical protein